MSQAVSYNNYAGSAAENYARYFVPVIPAPLAADLLQAAALRPGEHVVDVACGTGVVARMAAERVGTIGRALGIDPNPGMLEVARAAPSPPGAPVEWRQASAEKLPLSDQSFDFVLCQLGVMFFSDRVGGLREMHRVLAPGGRIAVNTPGPMPKPFVVLEEALRRHISPESARFVGAVFSLADASELVQLIGAAGFDRIEVTTATRTLRLPPPADFLWQYIASTPLGVVVGAADAAARERLEREVVTAWDESLDGGAMTLSLPVTIAVAQV